MTPKERKEQFVKSLKRFTNKYPTLYGLNTKELESLMTDIAGVESSYRSNVIGKTKDGKKSKYNGYYALKIPADTSIEEQHRQAFKHLANVLKHNITDVDVYRAGQMGISQAQLVGKYWNQGNRVTNYLWNGIDTSDGNGIKISEYGTNHGDYRITSDVNILRYVPDAIMDSKYEVKKGDTFSNIQERVRTDGRNYNRNGKDIIEIPGNKKLNPSKLKIGQTIQIQPEMNIQQLIPTSSMVNTIPSRIPFKKFGGKLRYGWGGIMSQDNLVKDIIYNPGKYNLTPANFNIEKYSKRKANRTDREFSDYSLQFTKGYDINDIVDAWAPYAEEAAYDHAKFQRQMNRGARRGVNIELNDFAIGVLNDFMTQQQQTVVNMQNRIDDDIAKVAQIKEPSQPIVRYGGVLVRPRFDYGGYYSDYSTPRIPYTSDYSQNNPITAEDIPDDKAIYGVEAIRKATMLKGVGTGASIGGGIGGLAGGVGATILGTSLASGASGAAAGAAGGAAAGAAAGAASTAWIPIIGPLVALVAAGIGAGIGAGVSKKKANQAAAQQLAQNKQQIAYNAELNRQTSVGNAINRIDKDVYKIQNTENTFNMSQGFYSKYGGMIKPRIKYANGGIILPNSNNTVVAYGRTHEQTNPMTGETGITYGNVEIEGGGYVNGRELPGEVVRATPYGDEVFSDSIPIDNKGRTVADYAKMISDRKGVIEKIMNETRLNMERDIKNLNTSRVAKAKTGTLIRNIEKQATLFNKYTAESAKLDSDLEKLFAYQEQAASAMGLREGQPMRYGGSIRRTYDVGGWLSPALSFGMNALTSGLQYWAADADAKYKQEILDGLAKRTLPKRAKEDPILLDPEYDITPEMNATEREASRIEKYIKDNVVNPKQARNLVSKVRLDKLEQQNKLRGIKKSEEKKLINANIASIITARNKNRTNQYQDLVDQLNYDTNIAIQQMSIRSQKTQATQQLLRDLGQSATQAAQMYMVGKAWAPGVTKDMNGNIIGGNFKRMSNEDLASSRYKLYVGHGEKGMKLLVDKNQLPNWYNKLRATNWYNQMVKRGLFE